jgi:hypothetical protein
MSDDAIRERHGCECRKDNNLRSAVTIWEHGDDYIAINGVSDTRYLTQWQARYLAAKLYRLSRRIRDRSAL